MYARDHFFIIIITATSGKEAGAPNQTSEKRKEKTTCVY